MVAISSITAVAQTTANINFSGLAADGTVDLQLSPRPDFQFCVCPTINVSRSSPYGAFGLNGQATYYARARDRRSSGAISDWSATAAFRTTDTPARVTAPAAVMIEPAMIVVPEPVLQWISSTGVVAGFPLSNMGLDAPVAARITTGGPSYQFTVRLSGAPIDVIALLQSNAPEAAQVSIYAFVDDADAAGGPTSSRLVYSGPFRASPNLPGRMGFHCLARLAAPVSGRTVWLVQVAGANPFGYILEIGHAVFGLNRMSKNHTLDKTETPSPMTTVERRRSGMVDRVRGLPMRREDFDLSFLREAQYETIYSDLWRHEGEAVLMVPNTKAGAFLHDRIRYGDFLPGRVTNPSSPYYSRSISILSLI